MRTKLGALAAGLALCLALTSPLHAASQAETELKADIDAAIERIGTSTQGIVKWEGADRIDISGEGGGAVARIDNARIVIGVSDAKPVRVNLDHLEIRRTSAPDNAIKLDIALPGAAEFHGDHGQRVAIKLKDAKTTAVLDAASGRARETDLSFGGARVEETKNGNWISLGPLFASSKLVGTAGGGWSGPIAFELKDVEFFITDGPVAGLIERIAYSAESSGPDLAAVHRARDRLEAVQKDDNAPPDKRIEALLTALSDLLPLIGIAKGELSVERFLVRVATGEPLVSFDKATVGGALTGLSGDAAALRIIMRHEGLVIAPNLLPKERVPQRVVLDFGVERVETAPLRAIVELARKLREGSDAQKNAAQQQMLGAASRLNPTFRIYDAAVDLPDVGIDAGAEVKGSPLAPKGYTASGDISVRGFEAVPNLVGPAPPAEFLPLLNELGTTAAGPDGTPRLKFHLASVPPKWLTVNGNDMSAWFVSGGAGAPRVLRPANPVMTGDDVSAVQQALVAASVQTPQNGRYDGPTAVAIARYQKRNGLDVNGVVDVATRQKLGVVADPPERTPQSPSPGTAPKPPSKGN